MGAWRASREPVPTATLLVGLLTAAVSIVAIDRPAILHLLERHPTTGQPLAPWRLLAPLLVHHDRAGLTFNLAGLAVVGTAVERRLGVARWGVLYLVGGIVGELVGARWQPVGAGNSVASFGLVGGMLAVLLGRGSGIPDVAVLYAVGWVAVYTGLALGDVPGAVIAGVLCAPLGALIARARHVAGRAPGAALACGTLLAALLLCARRDVHGPPLIAGTIVGAILRRRSPATP